MKTAIATLLVITLTCNAWAQTQSPDMSVTLRGYLPAEKDDWNYASGIEMQARFWGSPSIGTAFVVGMDSWHANTEYAEEEDEFGYMATSVYGDVTLIPVGISALFRNKVSRSTSMIVEAGLRYVFSDSNINAETAYGDSSESVYSIDRIQTDNPLLGVVGLTISSAISDEIYIHGGMRYQFDLVETHERFLGQDIGETSFQSASVDIGVAWKF